MSTRKQLIPPLGLAFACTLALAPALALGQPAAQPPQADKSAVIVPMADWQGRPVVGVMLNGKGPFRLLLDTGTTFPLVLDEDLFREIKADDSRHDKEDVTVEGGELSVVKRLTIGSVEFSDVKVITTDLTGLGSSGAEGPRGILGLPLFSEYLLTLDYPRRHVILRKGALPALGGNVLPLDPGAKQDPCPALTVSVAGVVLRVHIDSGSPGFITLLNKTQKQLPLEGEPKLVGRARTPDGSADVRAGKLKGALKIGPFEYEDPRVEFADLGPMVRFDAGNIGYQLLKDFALTFDQKNGRVQLRQAKQE